MRKASPLLMVVLSAALLAGCGSKPAATAAPVPSTKTKVAAPAQPATPATAQQPAQPATPAQPLTPVAPKVGTLLLELSSLKSTGELGMVDGLMVSLAGAGLKEPLQKKLSADEVKNNNTLAFENIPAGKLTVTLTAFNPDSEALGQKSADVEVKPDAEVKSSFQLKLSPTMIDGKNAMTFGFDVVDGLKQAEVPANKLDDTTPPKTEEPVAPKVDMSKALEVEITDKEVVRSWLIFKKLAVTIKITNTNASMPLSGEVKCEFHKMKGIITKEDAIVETLTSPVKDLAPGKSVEITLTSSVSAEDAEATVHTISKSSVASTFE